MAPADNLDHDETNQAGDIAQALSSNHFSHNFVPLTTKSEVLHSLCLAIKKLRYTLRWRYHFSNSKNLEPADLNTTADEEDSIFDAVGLNSGCKLKEYKSSPEASPEIELFIKNLTYDLLKNIRHDPVSNPDQDKISSILQDLKNTSDILAKTDKSGKFTQLECDHYISILKREIGQNSTPISREEAQESIKILENLLRDNSYLFNKKEYKYILHYLDLKKLPQPFCLIKDHKKVKPGEDFQARLILPETGSYSYGFKRVLTSGLKRLLDLHGILPLMNKRLILNSFACKEKLQKLKLEPNFTFLTVDVVSMFPSTSHALIVKSVNYFLQKLNLDITVKNSIMKILELFNMVREHEIFGFQDGYFSYVGAGEGLAMGWSQSCLLTDICIAPIYDFLWTEGVFATTREVVFAESYRDDGLCILNKGKNFWENGKLENLKAEISAQILQFSEGNYKVTFDSDFTQINFLDLSIEKKESELKFSIFLKPEQQITYLNHSSMHHQGSVNSLPKSIMYRLASLTSEFDPNELVSKQFPSHFNAMQNAGLVTENFKYKPNESTGRKQKNDNRKIFFTVAYAKNHWYSMPHVIIKRNLKKCGLKFRISMSYTKFRNLEGLVKSDAARKVLEGFDDLNFRKFPCNCQGGIASCKIQNPEFRGQCRERGVIYQISCLLCEQNAGETVYIGSTQQNAKDRISAHLGDVGKILRGKASRIDSFTDHFIKKHREFLPDKGTIHFMRENTSSTILRKNLAYGLGTNRCGLCKMEKFFIHEKRNLCMNARHELFSSCRHKSKMVHFTKCY